MLLQAGLGYAKEIGWFVLLVWKRRLGSASWTARTKMGRNRNGCWGEKWREYGRGEDQEEPGNDENSVICLSITLYPCLAQALPLNSRFVCPTSHLTFFLNRNKPVPVNMSPTELNFCHILAHLRRGTLFFQTLRSKTLGDFLPHPKSYASGYSSSPSAYTPIWPLSPFSPDYCLG